MKSTARKMVRKSDDAMTTLDKMFVATIRLLPRAKREQLLASLEHYPISNYRFPPGKIERWHLAAEKMGLKVFQVFMERAADLFADQVLGASAVAHLQHLFSDSFDPQGLQEALAYEQRQQLKQALTCDGLYSVRLPVARLKIWRRAADEAKVEWKDWVEDALDEAGRTPGKVDWIEKASYKADWEKTLDEAAYGSRHVALRFPEVKISYWRELAGDEGLAIWSARAFDAYMMREVRS